MFNIDFKVANGIFVKPLLSFRLSWSDIWGFEVSSLKRKKCNDLSFTKEKKNSAWSLVSFYWTSSSFGQEYLSCDHIEKMFDLSSSLKHMQVIYSIYYYVWNYVATKLRGKGFVCQFYMIVGEYFAFLNSFL